MIAKRAYKNVNHHLPIEGDLKGYLSGKSTLTFHTPPSYGAKNENNMVKLNHKINTYKCNF